MKATARMLTVLTAVACCVSASPTLATPLWVVTEVGLATVVAGQAPSSGSLSRADKLRQADDLLARARQAMSENQLTVAEKLIAQAETLGAEHNPLNPLADTPVKARRDLERRRASTQSASGSLFTGLPLGKGRDNPPAADPFSQRSAALAGAGATGPISDAAISDQLAGTRVTPLPAIVPESSPGFATVEASAPAGPPAAGETQARLAADGLVLAGRRALAMGDVRRASEMVEKAKGCRATYGPKDDSPQLLQNAIEKYGNLIVDQAARKHTESYRRQFARLMMEQSDALLAWRDYGEAERLANQAKAQGINYGPLEANPDTLLERIAVARRQNQAAAAMPGGVASDLPGASLAAKQNVSRLVHQSRSAYAAGDLGAAEAYAKAAVAMQVPESSFAPGEDRPGMILLDIQKARLAGAGAVVPAGGSYVASPGEGLPPSQRASRAVYDANQDRTRTIQAAHYQETPAQPTAAPNTPTPAPPTPLSTATPAATPAATPVGANAGETLFQQGEAALKARNVDQALQYYRQAAAYRDQLDPLTAQRLQDRLQLHSMPAPENVAAPPPGASLAKDAPAKQQMLAGKVNNDVSHQERRAAELCVSDPKAALDLLQQSRMRVEAAGLEPAARTAILRRVDRNIAEMRQFLEDNRSRIELTDQNRQTYEEVDRQQKFRVEVQEKMALLVDDFNRKIDEQRYPEAEVIAKRAADLEPNSPVAQQLVLQAKFIRRVMNEASMADAKERGVIDALGSVDDSSRPFDDRDPYRFPDPTKWNELTENRKKLLAEQGRRRTERDIEIEQKLKTPVSLRFENASLATVLDHLAQLAEVNLYMDPQGLQEEGVSSDTPVTINLRSDISLKSALNLILQPLHLSYVIKDEVLKITSEQYRDNELVVATYNVADLVIPIPNFTPNSRMGMAGAYNDAMGRNGFNSAPFGGDGSPLGVLAESGAPRNTAINSSVLAQMSRQTGAAPTGGANPNMPMGFGPGGLGGGANADFDSLIELITTTIKPQSWDELGGPGSIKEFATNLTLVVSQTQEVQEDIADLLAQLRRLQDLQVTIEVRFITLNDNFFERIGVDFDFDINDNIDRPYQVFGRKIETTGDDDDDTTANTEPARNTTDTDGGRSVTVGMSAPGIFAADLDIPFTQGSFGLAVPQFGGFDATAGASLGFAILSDIEAFFFINAAQGDRRTNILQAPKVTLFNGQQAFVSDTSQSPFVISVVPVVGDFAAAQQPVIVVLSEGTFLT
ncbi:MAG: hypothetical protein NTW96_16480, partial [Planctomycetia bacterium]|nr:hypothetical protein [Planctomycetia bacterium]